MGTVGTVRQESDAVSERGPLCGKRRGREDERLQVAVTVPRSVLIQNELPCFAPRSRTTPPPTILESLRVSGSESPRNGAQP